MDIPNYPNYWIDPCGNVYSRYANKFLRQYTNKNGYKYIQLYKNKTQKNFSIHRLVALCYLDNPNNYPMVNHKNCKRDDNRFENLEWCDRVYNNQSINSNKNIGNIKNYGNKYCFRISVNKTFIYYNCPSKCIAEAMRNIYIDLL